MINRFCVLKEVEVLDVLHLVYLLCLAKCWRSSICKGEWTLENLIPIKCVFYSTEICSSFFGMYFTEEKSSDFKELELKIVRTQIDGIHFSKT